MKLTRTRGFAERLAGRRFTNRTGSLALFSRELEKLEENAKSFRVISFYGMGGIGKTALLKELRDKHSTETVTWIRLDLESTLVKSPVDAVYEIYREAGLRDFVVEYALALIWEYRGRSIEDIRNRLVSTDGVLAEVADIAFGAAESFVGARTIRRLFDASVDTVRRKFGDSAATVDLLNAASDSEREQLLVELIAKAIRRHADEGRRYIFGVDSLHWMKKREGYLTSDRNSDDWLLELIGGAKAGLWLLTSREKLKWAEEMPDWSNFLEEHLLGSLSNVDCNDFLQNVPVTHPEIAAKIKENSRGIPIFLDLAASYYLSVAQDDVPLDPEDFEFDPTNLVQRYLSHLDRTHSEAIELLALFDEFDDTLAQTLFARWHLRISVRDYQEVCSSILALPLDQEFGTHRIHTDIRETIARKLSSEEIGRACEALIDLLWDRIFMPTEEMRDPSYLAWVFGRVLYLINTQVLRLGQSAASRLFLVGHRLIEAGHHDAFADQVVAHANDWGKDSREVQAAVTALDAFILRRSGKLTDAQQGWARLPGPLGEVMSSEAESLVRYLKAHTEHLLGHYEGASQVYRTVLKEAEAALRSAPHLLLARRQLADIDMLSGQFSAALAGFSAELRAGGTQYGRPRPCGTWVICTALISRTIRPTRCIFRPNGLRRTRRRKSFARKSLPTSPN